MPDNDFAFLSKPKSYYIYIVTNEQKSILETGITGDLVGRLYNLAHGLIDNTYGTDECYKLLYLERFEDVHEAMKRDRELKNLSLKKKKGLVETQNPDWRFLNDEIHQIV